MKRHGFTSKDSTKLQRSFHDRWTKIKIRCFNPSHPQYHDYGGRGISVCNDWMKFENFRDDMWELFHQHIKEYGLKNTTIDRIDNDRDYTRENCRWATRFVQNQNQRIRKDNKSGIRGVHWDKANRKWQAGVERNKKKIFLGNFKDLKDAIKAVKNFDSLDRNNTNQE